MDFTAAYRSAHSAAVDFTGIVSGAPHFFYGNRTHAEHEAFDNVKIAPPVPVHDGDRVETSGVMVHD